MQVVSPGATEGVHDLSSSGGSPRLGNLEGHLQDISRTKAGRATCLTASLASSYLVSMKDSNPAWCLWHRCPIQPSSSYNLPNPVAPWGESPRWPALPANARMKQTVEMGEGPGWGSWRPWCSLLTAGQAPARCSPCPHPASPRNRQPCGATFLRSPVSPDPHRLQGDVHLHIVATVSLRVPGPEPVPIFLLEAVSFSTRFVAVP